jgi:hypothetical protein
MGSNLACTSRQYGGKIKRDKGTEVEPSTTDREFGLNPASLPLGTSRKWQTIE